MAKSMRSKSKRAFRRTKREEGVYAAVHAARLERLSAKLAAKVSADKDGDQAMEEEEPTEEQVEGGEGEDLFAFGYHSRGVDAREWSHDSGLPLGSIHENVTGGEDNLNSIEELCELMACMSLDEGLKDVKREELDHSTTGRLVYDSDGDVVMLDLCQLAVNNDTEMEELYWSMARPSLMDNGDIEMAELDYEPDPEMESSYMSPLRIEGTWYHKVTHWRLQDAQVEAYEDMDDGSSVGDESELITPVQLGLGDPDEWQEDNALFQTDCDDSLSGAIYTHAQHLKYARPSSGDGTKGVEYPSLFQEDLQYEAPW